MNENRNRMEPAQELIEVNPHWDEDTDAQEWQWRSFYEVEEWAYDQGYDCRDDELWNLLPSSRLRELGEIFLKEGKNHAREWVNEEIQECVSFITEEELNSYVDGQMRLYAGYDVAENGDTLEEGDHGTWEDLQIMWEAGVQDKLRGNERYSSIQ